MPHDIDFLHFTSLRFRNVPYEELLPTLTKTVTLDYQSRGASVSQPNIFLHKHLPDTIVVENCIPPEDSIPKSYPKLYVDPLCAAAVLRGSDIFASGVVGLEPEAAACTDGATVSVFACLGKFNAGFKQCYGGEARFLGNGLLAMPGKRLLGNIHANSGVAVSMTRPICVCPSFQSELFLSGHLVAQNLPSLVTAHVLGASPGEIVLDMCAAPGGKSLHLADLMMQQGTLIAVDKSAKRLQSVTDSAARLGIDSSATAHRRFLRTFCFDSCRLCEPDGADPADPSAPPPPYLPGRFDRVLLDAPCSALGQRPRLTTGGATTDQRRLDSFPPLQRRLLRVASQLLKSGGTLVYSTCTTRPEENESQVLWALANLPRLRLCRQTPNLRPLSLVPGSPDVQKFSGAAGTAGATGLGGQEPCDWDTIGFFIAKFVAA